MSVNNCVQETSKNGFESKIKNLAVVDFFAEWCMPCLMMSPIIEEVADKFKGKIDFCKVNIDENSELAEKYNVMSIPTLVVFSKGKEVERIVGAMPQDALEEKLKKYLN
jgi:thioredoxin 1